MKVRALVSFSGKIHMTKGEVGEITDQALVMDLLRAGLVEEVKNKTKGAKK